jgi:hypothetical protein
MNFWEHFKIVKAAISKGLDELQFAQRSDSDGGEKVTQSEIAAIVICVLDEIMKGYKLNKHIDLDVIGAMLVEKDYSVKNKGITSSLDVTEDGRENGFGDK